MENFKGTVVKGDGRGRKIGFPTLNLEYQGELDGIYVAEVLFEGKAYLAAAHLGGRPTFDDLKRICELHIIDFDGSLGQGDEIEVKVLHKIREVMRFENVDDLVSQIADDVAFTKSWYKMHR